MRIFRMILEEIKAIVTQRKTLIPIVAVILIPLLYSSLFLWAFWNPYGKLDKMPVAVVNQDLGTTYHSKSVHVGDDIVHRLKKDHQFGWEFVNAQTAQAGLKNNHYYMVIEIPTDFSHDSMTVMDTHPTQAKIVYTLNDSYNYLSSQLSRSAMERFKESLTQNLTKGYTQVLFQNISHVTDGLKQASTGSQSITNGIKNVHEATSQIDSNLQVLVAGSTELTTNLQAVANGADKLTQGTKSLTKGITALHNGLDQLTQAQRQLQAGEQQEQVSISRLLSGQHNAAVGTTNLANGTNNLEKNLRDMTSMMQQDPAMKVYLATHPQLAQGMQQLVAGGQQVVQGASQLAIGQQQLTNGTDKLAAGQAGLVLSLIHI